MSDCIYTVYANTNMAGTRIVCIICMVNLGRTRSGLVVSTSNFGTSEAGSISGWAPTLKDFKNAKNEIHKIY